MKKSPILAALVLGLSGVIASIPAFADSTLYDNTGPESYDTDAYAIYGSQEIGDSFTLSQNATVTGVDFVEWTEVLVGDPTPTSLDWSISTGPFSGYLATGSGAVLSGSLVGSSDDVYQESFSVPDLSLSAGTYWLELGNAMDSGSGFDYWDWSGGPSLAAVAYDGAFSSDITPSETFQILGTPETVTPEPSSFLLMASGLAGLAGMVRRKLRA